MPGQQLREQPQQRVQIGGQIDVHVAQDGRPGAPLFKLRRIFPLRRT
jgi:hypothetical protein